LLEHRAEIGLTASQARALIAIDQRWHRESHPLQDALARAAREFQSAMRAHGGNGVTVQALQERAADTSAPSPLAAACRRWAWAESPGQIMTTTATAATRIAHSMITWTIATRTSTIESTRNTGICTGTSKTSTPTGTPRTRGLRDGPTAVSTAD